MVILSVPYSILRKFGLGTFTIAECNKQTTDVSLLVTFGDGGRGRVVTNIRYLLITLSVQLYTAQWVTGHKAIHHMGPLASADTC